VARGRKRSACAAQRPAAHERNRPTRPGGRPAARVPRAARGGASAGGSPMEVGRRWGGGERLAQWRSGGGQLRWGGPKARCRGEGGAAGVASEREEKHGVEGGGGNPSGGGRQHPFKGGSGDIAEGGSGEVGRCVERHEEGGPGSHRWGTARAA
jgi:hypothetical protein